ncbi:MAG: GMC family oxidoreductase [Steroidobacteraceae bacterium]
MNDVIIIGSGAGGSAAAHALVNAGLKVILIEKGNDLPRDGSTLDPQQVVHEGRFRSREGWRDGLGRDIEPEEYFNVGGKTRWYGAALLRYGEHEFGCDNAHGAPGWPIEPAALDEFYREAEHLLGVRQFECEPNLSHIARRLQLAAPRWRAQPLPLGLHEGILDDAREARHFDGFASVRHLKGDAESAFLRDLRSNPNLRLLTGSAVVDLLPAGLYSQRVAGVRLEDGTTHFARAVILAAGALHSPRLLQRYVRAEGLDESLACADQIGRTLKLHLLTAMVAVSPGIKRDLIRKTLLLLHDDFPHSSIQPLGFDGELISTLVPRIVPRPLANLIGERAYGFFLQTEDSAHPDNRVIGALRSADAAPVLDYSDSRSPAALQEHRELVRRFRKDLARSGLLAFSRRIGITGTAHASGTLSAGSDPLTSVVDAQGRVHGLDSLYVVDGSILPRSSRVNPSLTIFAWSLRCARLLAQELHSGAFARRSA